jgi:hypothetical protein
MRTGEGRKKRLANLPSISTSTSILEQLFAELRAQVTEINGRLTRLEHQVDKMERGVK